MSFSFRDYGDESHPLKVDIIEAEEELKITADLPGVLKPDISISLNKIENTLRIVAFKKRETGLGSGEWFIYDERFGGELNRLILIPRRIIIREVGEMNLENGVLSITLITISAKEISDNIVSLTLE